MYLAPLNYDRFFKKVFSDTKIAKRFIEDFLDIVIEEIEAMPDKYKITDDAAAIEFDFRCKVGDKYIVVDMQQWYKPDVVKRFYLYHCMNTALQMEAIPSKAFPIGAEKKRPVHDYRMIEPVITIVWLVDETLGTTEDFISYVLTPEQITNFIRREELWHKAEISEMLANRVEMLSLLNYRTKSLDFLAQNKLIFAFQNNIVKHDKLKPYVSWFRFAEKTRDKNNTEADFIEFKNDDIFSEIIRRINKSELKTEDFEYIKDFGLFAAEYKRWIEGVLADGREEGIELGREEGIELGREEGIELGREEGIELGVVRSIQKLIRKMPDATDVEIANLLDVSVEKVQISRTSMK